jgi:AcrR family transcriptional regulator
MTARRAAAERSPSVAEAFAERAVRREGDRELPLGPKARRTRAAILEAAARLFSEYGYQGTAVGDVAAAAGVSLGTVYQYFRDRSDLVAALLQASVTTMLDRADTAWRASEGSDGLFRVLVNFVSSYAEHAAMSEVWEEVSHVDEDLAELRRTLTRVFEGTVAREVRRAGRAGLVRDDVDADLAARALAGMVDRFCYLTYVFDPPTNGEPSPEEAAGLLTKLWASAIGMTTELA